MKERLDQFTMAQFIDIVCGDRSSIGAEDDKVAERVALSLVTEYNNIADPIAAKARVVEGEHKARLSAKIAVAKICMNLINVYGAYDEVRGLLEQSGFAVSHYSDERLKKKVEQIIRSVQTDIDRTKTENQEEFSENIIQDFRASYDMQTARLMAHFKMSIDYNTITASIYANLVNMACSQQRRSALK